MTYTKEIGKKWENENGKTSHLKVLMVNDEEECEKECTATVPCIAFTFIPGMDICALKAPKDAVNLVTSGGGMISDSLDGERPGVEVNVLNETICLSCMPGFVPSFTKSLTCLSFHSSLQRGEGDKVLRPQPVPTGCRDRGGVCSRLSSGTRVPLLDAQPQCGQVLAKEVGSWKEPVVKRIKLWTEVLWCHRWVSQPDNQFNLNFHRGGHPDRQCS